MAELSTIARPYAQAIFEIAREQGQYDKWSEALARLSAIVKDDAFATAAGDPRLDRSAVKQLVASLLSQSDADISHLVNVLVDNHRLLVAPAIFTQFEHLRHEQEGILDAVVESAFPVSDSEKGALLKDLEKKFGRQVRADVVVKPELIGGVRIIIGDVVIDGSVKAKIEQMTAALKH
ncbi:MAG: F0F1 ATP synthase subunit delta [Betaproteobacteria bacterium]|nr:F0F1 ATP synthase subunit delta [Betaproteobacteria bacterium]